MANPPPPPPRPRGDATGRRGDATGSRHENLSNADFRQMVIDTPRRMPPPETPRGSKKKNDDAKRPRRKFIPKPKEKEKTKHDDVDIPRYRDRAKERREDQNPDYEEMTAGPGAFHAVAPPGALDIPPADAEKISIEKSKYLGGDVEHTHLVKGLDYALLNKKRSEMEKKSMEEAPETKEEKEKPAPKPWSENDPLSFHSSLAKVVHHWLVKPPTGTKVNQMFLPGRMAFVFDMEDKVNHIPTNLHRSKADCPAPEDYVTVGVDAPVLDRISKIMAYLKLGTSGKVLKKKKKAKPEGGELAVPSEDVKVGALDEHEQHQPQNDAEETEQAPPNPEENIFEDVGTDYVPTTNNNGSPHSEDMEESPRNDVGPVQGPSMPAVQWQEYPGAAPADEAYPGPWPQYSEEQPDMETDRDDKKRRKELDAREKDPNFVSESYSECYPSYQEYGREVADSDDEGDLTKMDMGGKAKGRLHRWDFETEAEWAKYNDQKEAMPKAAYQFGVKMQDGRKTRKHKEQKLSNELNKINQIIEKKKRSSTAEDEPHVTKSGKRLRT